MRASCHIYGLNERGFRIFSQVEVISKLTSASLFSKSSETLNGLIIEWRTMNFNIMPEVYPIMPGGLCDTSKVSLSLLLRGSGCRTAS